MRRINSFIKWLGFVSIFFIFTNNVYAQSEGVWEVDTKSGNQYVGTVISKDADKIVLKIKEGEITIQRIDIVRMRPVSEERLNAKYFLDNPHPSRYFFGPSGFGLQKGEGYYQNNWVLLNQVSYGLTDNFSMGAGLIPLFLFGGSGEYTPFWVTPKFSIPVEKNVNIGVGGIFASTFGSASSWVGIPYGLTTFGNTNTNITLGLGYGFAGKEWAKSPLVTVSGTARVSKKTYLLTETYFLKGSDFTIGLMSFGARSTGKKLAVDYGLWVPFGGGEAIEVAIPWLGITVPFGNTRN